MNNTKMNKRTLLSGIIAIFVCISMLIGTTFAWFTDSVSSGTNNIVAGNLDVSLKYLKDGDWTDVTGKTDLFQTDKWEPGTTDVVYLKVENEGSLALVYKFVVKRISETIGVDKDGSPIKLSEILKFGIIDISEEQRFTRDEARVAVSATGVTTLDSYTNNNVLASGGTKYHAIVVYMPETTGNNANYATGTTAPSIEMGLDLIATQASSEHDSFGNDYDQNATQASEYTIEVSIPVETVVKALPTNIVTQVQGGVLTAVETVSTESTVEAGGIRVTYPADTVLDTTPIAGAAEGTVESSQDATQGLVYTGTESLHSITLEEGEQSVVYDLTLPVSQSNTTLIKIVEKLATGLNLTEVYHSGVALAQAANGAATPTEESFFYNAASGELFLWVYHASEIATVTKDRAPVESMFPDINTTIKATTVGTGDTVLFDETSGTKATIPANAVEKGILSEGQEVYLIIIATQGNDNSMTYDISIRDRYGVPFDWSIDCMPEVTLFLGKAEDLFGFNLNAFEYGWAKIYDRRGAEKYPEAEYGNQFYDGTGDEYGAFKYGADRTPGMTYDPITGFVTLRSLTFE